VTRHWRQWRPATALSLGGLAVLLAGLMTPLSLIARQNPLTSGNAAVVVVAVSFAAVGLVVAWHRQRNPIGWLMIVVGIGFMLYLESGLYLVISYRLGHRLPLASVVLFWNQVSQPLLGLLPLTVLLFPDGQLPSRRWRSVLYGYFAVGLADMIALAQMSVYLVAHHRTQVDATGHPIFATGVVQIIEAPVALVFFAMWLLAVGYQVISWRRAVGVRRQQLNWLMAGSAVCLIAFLAATPTSSGHGFWDVVSGVLYVGMAALPAGMGVAILKYRLYEINRIISRTLAYTIVTGLLVGVYAGLVLLATRELSVSSPVAVAVATLAAAALFHPLRRLVQLRVDRRFNRARYDADRIVAEFARRLHETVDLDSVRDALARVVHQALEPAHVSVWVNEHHTR
jgi:hypothetical protein